MGDMAHESANASAYDEAHTRLLSLFLILHSFQLLLQIGERLVIGNQPQPVLDGCLRVRDPAEITGLGLRQTNAQCKDQAENALRTWATDTQPTG